VFRNLEEMSARSYAKCMRECANFSSYMRKSFVVTLYLISSLYDSVSCFFLDPKRERFLITNSLNTCIEMFSSKSKGIHSYFGYRIDYNVFKILNFKRYIKQNLSTNFIRN
jgi:hypothetical protein